jgi:hypothetical protein
MINLPCNWKVIEILHGVGNHKKKVHRMLDENSGQRLAVLYLTKGQFTVINWEDIHKVAEYNWYAKSCGKYGYTVCTDINYKVVEGKKRKDTLFLHQLLTGTFKSDEVCDHINDTFPDSFELDNRQINLRVTSKSVNQKNRRLSSNNTTGALGVVYSKKDRGYFGRVHHMGKLPYSPLFSESRYGCLYSAKCAAAHYTEVLRFILYEGLLEIPKGSDDYILSRLKIYLSRI